MSTDNFKDHFSQGACGYAKYRPHYSQELVTWLANLVSEKNCAWDCGCGNGQLSVPLANHFDRVLASDASADQIAQARPHPRISYRVATAEKSAIDAQSVNLIVVAQAVHWFALDSFYREVRRVAAGNAAIALLGYGLATFESAALDRALKVFYSDDLGRYWPAERRHIDTAYRDLAFPFAEIATPDFAMESRWTLAEFSGYLQTWSAVSEAAKNGASPLEKFLPQLQRLWGDAGSKKRMRWPIILRAGKVED